MKNDVLKIANEVATHYGYADYQSVPAKYQSRVWQEAMKKIGKKSLIKRLFRV